MSAAAERAVDVYSVVLGDKERNNFIPQHRTMIWTAHMFLRNYSGGGLKTVAATLS